MLAREVVEVIEPPTHQRLGIEQHDRLARIARQGVRQELGLDRLSELVLGQERGEHAQIVDARLLGAYEGERLGVDVVLGDRVQNESDQAVAGVGRHGLGEHTGPSDFAAAHDGDDPHRQTS